MSGKRKAEGATHVVKRVKMTKPKPGPVVPQPVVPKPVVSKAVVPKQINPRPVAKKDVTHAVIPDSDVGSAPYVNTTYINGKSSKMDVPTQEQLDEAVYLEHPSADEEEEEMDNEVEEVTVAADDEEEESEQDEEEEDSEGEAEDDEDPTGEPDPIDSIKFPCSVGVVTKQWGGKTTLACELLRRRGHEFGDIFWFTKSGGVGALTPFITSPDHIIPRITEEFLTVLIDELGDKPKPTLLLFDDHVGMDFNFDFSPCMNELIGTGRNRNISIWMAVQAWTKVPNFLRANCRYYFIGNNFFSQNEKISKDLATELCPPKKMRKLLSTIARRTTDHHKEFMFIDDRNSRIVESWTAPPPPGESAAPVPQEESEEDDEDLEDVE